MNTKYSNLRFLECNKIKFRFPTNSMIITLNLHKYGLAIGAGVLPIHFVFDTGASLTQLNRETFVGLGYIHCECLGTTKVRGISGGIILVDVYKIPNFVLAGNLQVINSEVCVPRDPLHNPPNLLGQNSLEGFHYCANTFTNFLYFEKHSGPKKSRFPFWSNLAITDKETQSSATTMKGAVG